MASRYGLISMGAFRDGARHGILFGTGAGFWPDFTQSPEYRDGMTDPIDRWSERVLTEMRDILNANAVAFPFGGPPYQPFLSWAVESGEAFTSPVGMLVHTKAGLMICYRGALLFDHAQEWPSQTVQSPCISCAGGPCVTSCPVDALSAERGYDVAACHAFLDTDAGQDCLTNGCKARRACPISQRFGRDPAQSAFHMAAFHP